MRSVETLYKACVRTRVATSARLKPVIGAARGTGEEAIVFGKKKKENTMGVLRLDGAPVRVKNVKNGK